MSQHFLYSPSKSAQWLVCPASIVQTYVDLPADSNIFSYAAEVGTQAHEIAADVILGKKTYADIPDIILQDSGIIEPLSIYIKHCQDLCFEYKAKPMVEIPVPLFYAPAGAEANGWVDFCIMTENKAIFNDLKFGKGVAVSAYENTQQMIYAVAFLLEYEKVTPLEDSFEIDIWITQPRYGAGDPQCYNTTWGELKKFKNEVLRVAGLIEYDLALNKSFEEGRGTNNKVLIDKTYYQASKKGCTFCPLKQNCPELRRKKLEAIKVVFPEIGVSTENQDAFYKFIFTHVETLKSVIKETEDYLLTRLNNGAIIPGLARKRGKEGNRKWSDTMGLQETLLKDSRTQEVTLNYIPAPIEETRTPAEMEKLLKSAGLKGKEAQALIAEFTERTPGLLKVVLADTEDFELEDASGLE